MEKLDSVLNVETNHLLFIMSLEQNGPVIFIFFYKILSKKVVKYLLENCHFQLGNKFFRQIAGIPMSTNPAPISL